MNASQVPTTARQRFVACDGNYMVYTVDPGATPPNLAAVQELAVGFVNWRKPKGGSTAALLVGSDISQGTSLPWDITEGSVRSLGAPSAVAVDSTYFQELAQSIQSHIRHRMPEWRKSYEGVEDMTVAVMGCVVNGPGESKHANIGISLPGTGERPVAPVYIDGEKGPTLKGERIAEEFQELVEQYVARRYARRTEGAAAEVV